MFISKTHSIVRQAAKRIEDQIANANKRAMATHKPAAGNKAPKQEYIKANLVLSKQQQQNNKNAIQNADIRTQSNTMKQAFVDQDGGLGEDEDLGVEPPMDTRTAQEQLADVQFIQNESSKLAQQLFRDSEQARLFLDMLNMDEKGTFVSIAGDLMARFSKRKIVLATDVIKAYQLLAKAVEDAGVTSQAIDLTAAAPGAAPAATATASSIPAASFSKALAVYTKATDKVAFIMARLRRYVRAADPTTVRTDAEMCEYYFAVLAALDTDIQARPPTDKVLPIHVDAVHEITDVLGLFKISLTNRRNWTNENLLDYFQTPVLAEHMKVLTDHYATL